jgi:hypothetical protein
MDVSMKVLHDYDSKLVEDIMTILEKTEYKVNTNMPSTFIIRVEPGDITFNMLNQIKMLHSRIINMTVDIKQKVLIIKIFKYGKEKKINKKRKKTYFKSDHKFDSKKYKLKTVDVQDQSQIQSIIGLLVNRTTLEFDIDIRNESQSYVLSFTNVEPFQYSFFEELMENVGAFVSSIKIAFSTKKLDIVVIRNDSRSRKKVKLHR